MYRSEHKERKKETTWRFPSGAAFAVAKPVAKLGLASLCFIAILVIILIFARIDFTGAAELLDLFASPSASQEVLFSDSFDRTSSSTVGNEWAEVETTGADAGIQAGRLCFLDTSDAINRPLVRHSFPQVSSGEITWQFDFDWNRTRNESRYRHFMQVGQGSVMSDTDQNGGVGINLLWGRINQKHSVLAYRQAGVDTNLTEISGPAVISVVANLDANTYQVSVNDAVVGSGIPFDTDIALDTVRYFTDELNEVNFSGRCFDNLSIAAPHMDTSTPTASDTPTTAASETATSTATGIPEDTVTPTPTNTSSPAGIYTYELVEFQLAGPASQGLGDPNPFRIEADVTFSGPSGQIYIVPAFYDGDGRGGMDGSVWKVRFAPDQPGTWTYLSSSAESLLDGQAGTFEAVLPPDCNEYLPGGLANFSCYGRLEYAGGHYLKFRNGGYWIKGGLDDPENFLGAPFLDWSGKKAAIDYLASMGVNSIYVIFNNIGGDRNDTWPWFGGTAGDAIANSDRFDVAKLLLWDDFFSYVQGKGILLHLVLDDDSAWNGYDHELYYRQMVARFSYHPGIVWNIGEEANEIYTDAEQIDLATLMRATDPFDHPVTVHRVPTWPFLGNPNFDLASIQAIDGGQDFSTAALGDLNEVVRAHREASVAAGRPIPIMIDEIPRVTEVNASTQLKMRAEVLYPIFLGGGHHEIHYFDAYGQGGMVTIQDLEPMLRDMRRARQFVENLPFVEMAPCNELLAPVGNICMGKAGEIYALYLPEGGTINIDLTGQSGAFRLEWFDPRNDTSVQGGVLEAGSVQALTAPDDQDWALTMNVLPATPTSTATEVMTPGATPTHTETPVATEISTATPTPTGTPTPAPVELLSDSFDRVDSNTVGNGWIEVEATGANAGIQANRLCFLDTSDVINRPIVRRTFTERTGGDILWEFDFNWARTGPEGSYNLFMQLGQANLMTDGGPDSGAGVNLVWTVIGGVHQTLAYRKDGLANSLRTVSGPAHLAIGVNLDTHTYTASVDGVLVRTDIPFDDEVNLNTVRFLTSVLNEVNFSGRCFDNLKIQD